MNKKLVAKALVDPLSSVTLSVPNARLVVETSIDDKITSTETNANQEIMPIADNNMFVFPEPYEIFRTNYVWQQFPKDFWKILKNILDKEGKDDIEYREAGNGNFIIIRREILDRHYEDFMTLPKERWEGHTMYTLHGYGIDYSYIDSNPAIISNPPVRCEGVHYPTMTAFPDFLRPYVSFGIPGCTDNSTSRISIFGKVDDIIGCDIEFISPEGEQLVVPRMGMDIPAPHVEATENKQVACIDMGIAPNLLNSSGTYTLNFIKDGKTVLTRKYHPSDYDTDYIKGLEVNPGDYIETGSILYFNAPTDIDSWLRYAGNSNSEILASYFSYMPSTRKLLLERETGPSWGGDFYIKVDNSLKSFKFKLYAPVSLGTTAAMSPWLALLSKQPKEGVEYEDYAQPWTERL